MSLKEQLEACLCNAAALAKGSDRAYDKVVLTLEPVERVCLIPTDRRTRVTRVTVRVNGSLAAALGRSRLTVELPQRATLADLLSELSRRYPEHQELIYRAAPLTGGRHLSASTILTSSQEVALLMPIAGGRR